MDGTGTSAEVDPRSVAVLRPGVAALVQAATYGASSLVRQVTDTRTVSSLAGYMVPIGEPRKLGYSVALAGHRVLIGDPMAWRPFSREGIGLAWSTEFGADGRTTRVLLPAWSAEAHVGDWYGTAVALTGDGFAVLGPANGRVWELPGGWELDPSPEPDRIAPVRLFVWLDDAWREWLALPVDGVVAQSSSARSSPRPGAGWPSGRRRPTSQA